MDNSAVLVDTWAGYVIMKTGFKSSSFKHQPHCGRSIYE